MESDNKADKKVNKIFIIEGRDRIGKTTCIKLLIEKYEKLDYNVITLSNEKSSIMKKYEIPDTFNKLCNESLNFREYKGCSFESFALMTRRLFDVSDKPVCMIYDRLHLSTYVFGILLRTEVFMKTHQNVSMYFEYMNAFETYIEYIADSHLVTIITNHQTLEDDDENKLFDTMSAKLINDSISLYEHAHALSKMKNKYLLNILWDDSNQRYTTTEQFLSLINSID